MAESSERPGLFRRLLGGGPGEKVRTARYPLQAYGKLPIYKDFISVGLTDPAAREFRQWIDRGYSYRWAENEAYRDATISPHGFLVRLPESKSCVAGVLWGSSDEGGLRRFPFAVFLSFPAGQPAADPFAALHYLAALERQCAEIREGYAAGASLPAFYKAYRGAEFECALPTREQSQRELKLALGTLTVAELAEALYAEQANELWPLLGAELGEAARSDASGAIRLPLSGALPRSREIGFWLRWIDRVEGGRRRPATGLLFPGGRGPGRAVVFYRDLGPEDFLLLHPELRGQAGVLDVGFAAPAPAADAGGPAPPAPAVPVAPAPASAPPAASVDPSPPPSAPSEAEPLPFPEAVLPEVAAPGPRETLSALVVPAPADSAPVGAPASPQPPPRTVPAAPSEAASEAGTPPAPPTAVAADSPVPAREAPRPVDWARRLDAVVGL
jgi:type VI secretion system ImpM family protein